MAMPRRMATSLLRTLRQTRALQQTQAVHTASAPTSSSSANLTAKRTANVTKSSPSVSAVSAVSQSAPQSETLTQSESTAIPLQITPSCMKRLQHLSRERDTHVVLRVRVDGGGCSGFQYNFDLENWTEKPTTNSLRNDDDLLLQQEGVCILVDSISLSFISGSKIDYWEEMISSSFRVLDNPQSEASCGCGTSFAPKE